MARKFNLHEVREAIRGATPESKIYIGVDSERYRHNGVYYADYISAVVIHLNGKNGAKIYADVSTEKDYDNKLSRPFTRMMTEVYKAAELYMKLEDLLVDREFEIHLDINKDEQHGSSCALNQAIGYIRGTCNVTPIVKPHAWAASTIADQGKRFVLNIDV